MGMLFCLSSIGHAPAWWVCGSYLYPTFILRLSYVYPTFILRVSYVYPTCLVRKKCTKLVCFFDIDVLIFMEKNTVLCLLQEAVQARWSHRVWMCLPEQRVCTCSRVCRGARDRDAANGTCGKMGKGTWLYDNSRLLLCTEIFI